MKSFRLGSRAAGSAVAAVAGGAGATVHARAPPLQTVAPDARAASKAVDDEWLVTHLDGEQLLFQAYKPAEVDAALADVIGLFYGHNSAAKATPSLVITELKDEASSSSESSEGSSADAVIASTFCHHGRASATAEQLSMNTLLSITSKLLKRPGLQVEVVQCMMEDEEVRNLILGEGGDLDAYLAAVGIHTPGLLPPAASLAAAAAASSQPSCLITAEGDESASSGGSDLVSKLVHVVAVAVERTGSVFSFLGGWLRDRLAALYPLGPQLGPVVVGAEAEGVQREGEGVPEKQQQQQQARGVRAGGLMGKVMVVAVTVFVMLMLRRPIRFAKMA